MPPPFEKEFNRFFASFFLTSHAGKKELSLLEQIMGLTTNSKACITQGITS